MFNGNLKILRKEKGLSQEELAEPIILISIAVMTLLLIILSFAGLHSFTTDHVITEQTEQIIIP